MSNGTQNNTRLSALLSAVEKNLNLGEKKPVDASAWFLGPKAENDEALLELVKIAAEAQIATRKDYMPKDPRIFDEETKEHKAAIAIIKKELEKVLNQLRGSIPLASYRNQSHMYWDITLPGTAGYFGAMLYNQNNVAAEASPVTTMLEIQVGKDLCKMLGFRPSSSEENSPITPWGHITCDGSIANGESMWAARNLKFLPVALAAAIDSDPKLDAAKKVEVTTCQGRRAPLIELTPWELLNLPIDAVIGLISYIEKESKIDRKIISQVVDRYSVQNVGLVTFQKLHFPDSDAQATPLVLAPATAHYSWPKSAALIGLGTEAVKPIEVDLDGRMDVGELRRKLNYCLKHGRPVMQVVAVMGSTAEGAIDPLADIVSLREEFQKKGMNFVIHVDGAWGGYFTSMLHRPLGLDPAAIIDDFPELYISKYFRRHFSQIPHVDSVTLDPHKSGFIPYPAGSLCYRNGEMRDLIAYTSPVVSHGSVDPSVGPYGIEGSKPGAAAVGVYLSHKVIPLDNSGYGRILGRCLFNSKRFYAALIAMDLPDEQSEKRFNITALQRLPAEKDGASNDDVIKQKQYIKENIVRWSTKELIVKKFGMREEKKNEEQKKTTELFQAIGSDLSIISYAFNFKTASGELNTELELMNQLNDKIFNALSLHPAENGKIPTVEMFITASAFDPTTYGETLCGNFANRAGITLITDMPINFLISTTQNPWLSTTEKDFNMIDPLIEILSKTVNQAIDEIIDENKLNN